MERAVTEPDDRSNLDDVEKLFEPDAAAEVAWNESDHLRGQPENAGEFAPAGGGGRDAQMADDDGGELRNMAENERLAARFAPGMMTVGGPPQQRGRYWGKFGRVSLRQGQ